MNIQTFKTLYLLRFWQELYVTRHSIPGLPLNLYMVKSQLQYEAVTNKTNQTKSKLCFSHAKYFGNNAIKCSKEFKVARIKS